MIKPKIMRATNPQTGETIESIRWPNVFIYGLTDEEKEVLDKALPGKEVEITDITGEAICLVEKVDFAVIINPYNIYYGKRIFVMLKINIYEIKLLLPDIIDNNI